MGRIFICAIYGGDQGTANDPETIGTAPNEAKEMVFLRDLIVPELRNRSFEVVAVPDFDRPALSIDWIDKRAKPGDIALGIHADAYAHSQTRGVSTFYIAKNGERKNHAQMLLLAFSSRVPDLHSRGAKPDTITGTGSLAFCRRLTIPSLLMEIGFKFDSEDRVKIQAYRREIALGIADGLVTWSRDVQMQATSNNHTVPVHLKVNNEPYPEWGISIDGNVYIPIDLADRLGVNLALNPQIRRIRYRGIVYLKAIELRDLNISIVAEIGKIYNIRSQHPFNADEFDRIMCVGHTNPVQLNEFLLANTPEALEQFPNLPGIYLEEAKAEGVNHDLAFAQMCLETRFLTFGGAILPEFNNFASLGDRQTEWAKFPNLRLGIRAHIQQLKAYASHDLLVQECVAPRFELVRRGIAPTMRQLNGRWSADAQYTIKIAAVLRRLYETAGIF
ncbi:N-acetylmuramoyl-L-alanine amidase [Chamaesiphon sp. OTE_8_metabat_110]|uniref:hormogonium tapered terminus morphoprotein TftA n=1 Tax=Chamaesiphon sp. OTE_8_metabat_110 TaxID=2964696 RepID=UPI00286D0538|nr:N-acetylmuramoyl-L-alanine amidase [Chamaesiphon sp. OTE_8_metabat_110]